MSVVQLHCALLTLYFNKCLPLFKIYGHRMQIVRILYLFTMFFVLVLGLLCRYFLMKIYVYFRKIVPQNELF